VRGRWEAAARARGTGGRGGGAGRAPPHATRAAVSSPAPQVPHYGGRKRPLQVGTPPSPPPPPALSRGRAAPTPPGPRPPRRPRPQRAGLSEAAPTAALWEPPRPSSLSSSPGNGDSELLSPGHQALVLPRSGVGGAQSRVRAPSLRSQAGSVGLGGGRGGGWGGG
jgi:hypothetical protein